MAIQWNRKPLYQTKCYCYKSGLNYIVLYLQARSIKSLLFIVVFSPDFIWVTCGLLNGQVESVTLISRHISHSGFLQWPTYVFCNYLLTPRLYHSQKNHGENDHLELNPDAFVCEHFSSTHSIDRRKCQYMCIVSLDNDSVLPLIKTQ